MKAKNYYCILMTMLLFVGSSCSSYENKIPDLGAKYPINLDKTELSLSGDENSSTIKVDKSAWGIGIMRFYDESGERRYDNEFNMEKNGEDKSLQHLKTMSAEWLTATQSDSNLELVIELQENNTGKDRKVIITLAGGLGYKSVDLTINQTSK